MVGIITSEINKKNGNNLFIITPLPSSALSSNPTFSEALTVISGLCHRPLKAISSKLTPCLSDRLCLRVCFSVQALHLGKWCHFLASNPWATISKPAPALHWAVLLCSVVFALLWIRWAILCFLYRRLLLQLLLSRYFRDYTSQREIVNFLFRNICHLSITSKTKIQTWSNWQAFYTHSSCI